MLVEVNADVEGDAVRVGMGMVMEREVTGSSMGAYNRRRGGWRLVLWPSAADRGGSKMSHQRQPSPLTCAWAPRPFPPSSTTGCDPRRVRNDTGTVATVITNHASAYIAEKNRSMRSPAA